MLNRGIIKRKKVKKYTMRIYKLLTYLRRQLWKMLGEQRFLLEPPTLGVYKVV